MSDIDGLHDYVGYSVYEDGTIKSYWKCRGGNTRIKAGHVLTDIEQRELKQSVDYKGYKRLRLKGTTSRRTFAVHRLVALAFIPNPKNKPQVNYIDGNKQNNHVNNLEWVTQEENMAHAVEIGLRSSSTYKQGESNNLSKLTEIEVREIRRLKQNTDINIYELSSQFSVCVNTIKNIINYKTWKHI